MASPDETDKTAVPGGDPLADALPPATAATEPPAKAVRHRAPRKSKDPEELATEIERTREDLAETLDAIAEKVSPKRVAKRTSDKVTTAVKDTASGAVGSVKDGADAVKDKVTSHSSGGPKDAPPAPPTPLHAAPAWTPPAASKPPLPVTYVAAGAVAALLAWLLVRSRR